MKKKIDLAKAIVEADNELSNDNCRYPEDHYGCYIREWSKIVNIAEDILKKKRKR